METTSLKKSNLPLHKITEVEDFVDFLRQQEQDQSLVYAAAKLSEESFKDILDNPKDAEYDRL